MLNATRTTQVLIQGWVDDGNSSVALLSAGGVFTGRAMDISKIAAIFVNVYSDKASATDGLEIEQSADEVNWDHSDCYTVPAATGKNYCINPFARYMRVKYTNGAADQTAFRLQVVLKSGNVVPSSHRVQDTISNDDDARLTKAVITGENGGGNFKNVGVTADGDLTISDNSSGLAIAEGNVTGKTFIHKFGAAPDFDNGDGEVTIWDAAEDATAWELMSYVYSTTAAIDSISSTNNGDTQDIEIQGLDADYNLVTQTVTLTGQTRKALTTSLIRVFRAKNVGSTDLAGHVIIYENDTTADDPGVPDDSNLIRAVVQPENNQTEMCVFTIPAGKTGYLRSWYASTAGASKNTEYIMRMKARPFGQVFQLKHRSAIADDGTSAKQHEYVEPEVFAAKTDVEMTVEITGSPITGAAIAAGFDIVLVDD